MADVEDLRIGIQALCCSLSEEKLKEVCKELNITLTPESKGMLAVIRALKNILKRRS